MHRNSAFSPFSPFLSVIRLTALTLVAFAALAALAAPASALEIVFSPLPEEFSAAAAKDGSAGAFHGVSHLDLSHLRSFDHASFTSRYSSASALPEKYDLRDLGWTTPAKSQPLNNCWAYSACASLESTHLRKTGIALDLSETHLSWFAFNSAQSFNGEFLYSGGYDNMAVAMLARWSGAVLERDAPEGTEPQGSADSYRNRLHLENAFFLGLQFREDFARPTREMMKRLVSEHGGISVGICMASEGGQTKFYETKNNAWYYNGTRTRPDHAVLLVGWDDYYPRTNFREDNRPKAGGAWLAKNHWGPEFGDRGFFWVSYEDVSFGDGTAFLASETTNFDKNYGYDDLGWCNSIGDLGSNTIWLANVFSSGKSDENLEAVSFYTTANNAGYEITVYTGLSNPGVPSSGKAVLSQRGLREFAGYHTIRLTRPVSLPAGSTFAVAVKMDTPGYEFPGAVETVVKGYSDNAVANAGESFISNDGETWRDAGRTIGSNVCVRAFTKLEKSPNPSPTPGQDGGGGGGGGGCASGLPVPGLAVAVFGFALVFSQRRS